MVKRRPFSERLVAYNPSVDSWAYIRTVFPNIRLEDQGIPIPGKGYPEPLLNEHSSAGGALTRWNTNRQVRHSNVKMNGSEGLASRQDITIFEWHFGQTGIGRPNEAARSVVFDCQ